MSQSFPGLDWAGFPNYQFERTLRHGRRRAAEMRETASSPLRIYVRPWRGFWRLVSPPHRQKTSEVNSRQDAPPLHVYMRTWPVCRKPLEWRSAECR
nr:DUF1932 domain-containing protein [Neorhizobium lilium]